MSGCFDSNKPMWLCGFCMERYESADNHHCQMVRSLKDKFNDALSAIQKHYESENLELKQRITRLEGQVFDAIPATESKDYTANTDAQQSINFDPAMKGAGYSVIWFHRPLGKGEIVFDEEHKIQRAYKLSHLEKRLHQKNVQLREKTEAFDQLQKEYGERGRKLDAALNDLNCAIMNDRKSNEALMEAKITINRLHDQLGKAEAACAERVGHLGKALHCLQEENNKLRLQLMNKCCKDYPHVGVCHDCRKT